MDADASNRALNFSTLTGSAGLQNNERHITGWLTVYSVASRLSRDTGDSLEDEVTSLRLRSDQPKSLR